MRGAGARVMSEHERERRERNMAMYVTGQTRGRPWKRRRESLPPQRGSAWQS